MTALDPAALRAVSALDLLTAEIRRGLPTPARVNLHPDSMPTLVFTDAAALGVWCETLRVGEPTWVGGGRACPKRTAAWSPGTFSRVRLACTTYGPADAAGVA